MDHTLIHTLRTTGAVRSFAAAPIGDDVLHAILDDARFAPSGGNRQGWRVAVVRDEGLRGVLAGAMRPVWDEYAAISATGVTPFTAVPPSGYTLERTNVAGGRVPNGLIDDIASVPEVLAVAGDLSRIAQMDLDLGTRPPITGGASVYPFCWSVLLAARARGVGGVITTFLSRAEPAVAAALGLPSHYALVATIFLGYPSTPPAARLRRAEVESFTTLDRFDGSPFTVG